MSEVSLKQKILESKLLFCLKSLFFFTKSSFSQLFGQKWVFLVKLTYIQLPITKEWNTVETNFFS